MKYCYSLGDQRILGNAPCPPECVPADEYYSVLSEIEQRCLLLYPARPALDRLHSAKNYVSVMHPPTELLHLRRAGNAWVVDGDKDVGGATVKLLEQLQARMAEQGLSGDVMIKQGCSWGGEHVWRQALDPVLVNRTILQELLPGLQKGAQEITVMLQAMVPCVAELKWVFLDGQPRGHAWLTLPAAQPGRVAGEGTWMTRKATRQIMRTCGLAPDDATLEKLEARILQQIRVVLAEAARDNRGEVPQYMRVDMLVAADGRAWLGERESWGADLVQHGGYFHTDPTQRSLAAAMVARAQRWTGRLPAVCMSPEALFGAELQVPPPAPSSAVTLTAHEKVRLPATPCDLAQPASKRARLAGGKMEGLAVAATSTPQGQCGGAASRKREIEGAVAKGKHSSCPAIAGRKQGRSAGAGAGAKRRSLGKVSQPKSKRRAPKSS
mmetsp:Transcript_69597/g.185283  ORF Transcript_69597/g.185283 Transcript_69597/m.185283 type:complete len:439 (-) Transcript_69597:223-1539(-)